MSLNPTRTIHLPGEGLLPPSPEPMVPPDIGIKEIVRVVPPQPPHFPTKDEAYELAKNPSLPLFDRRYWKFKDALSQHPTSLRQIWVNNPGVAGMYGMGRGLDCVAEVIEFAVDGAKRKLPDLWESYGLFIVSTRLLDLLRDIDPDAIVHRPIVMRDKAGELIDDEHHLMDVVRNIWAVDFANSIIDYRGSGRGADGRAYPPTVSGYPSVRILGDLDPGFHIFRQVKDPRLWGPIGGGGSGCFVSDELKGHFETIKPKIRNLEFRPLYWGL